MNVLIIDDNPDFTLQLQKILEDFGVDFIKTVHTISEFKFYFDYCHFDLVIVDFLLMDGVNGVDLLSQISIPKDCSVWLMSQVIKEDNLPHDSRKLVNDFLMKPIDEQVFKSKLKQIQIESCHKKEIHSTFYSEIVPTHFLSEMIQAHRRISGNEIPLLYCLLSISKFTGHISLKNDKKQKSLISFYDGNLISIQVPHAKSYFGVLLADQGWLDVASIKKYLLNNQKGRIGEKLINSGLLSPHAVVQILKDQSKIRMSQLIQPSSVFDIQIQKDAQLKKENDSLDFNDIRYLLSQTLWSKVDRVWLKNFFSFHEDSLLKITSHQKFSRDQMSIPWIKKCQKIISKSKEKIRLRDIVHQLESEFSFDEEESLFYIYYLLTCKYLILCESRAAQHIRDLKHFEEKLQILKKKFDNQNYFEVFALPTNATDFEINQRFSSLVKLFHPDKYSVHASKKIKLLCEDVIGIARSAKDILTDPSKKKDYILEMKRGTKKDIVKVNIQYDEAQNLIHLEKYKEALEILENIKGRKELHSRHILYYCWARMGTTSFFTGKKEKDQIFEYINRCSLEDQYSDVYHFVKALYFEKSGYVDIAQNFLRKSIQINPEFLPARRAIRRFKDAHSKSSLVRRFFKSSS